MYAGLRIRIVVTAVIDDLAVGDPHIRPDAEAGDKACAAATAGPVAEGNVGVGAGATISKMHRSRGFSGMKGGLGTASTRIGDVIIGALAADLIADAIVRAVRAARSIDGWPAASDL